LKGYRKYFLNKLGWFLVTFVFAFILNFILPRLMPGDPVAAIVARYAQGLSNTTGVQAIYQQYTELVKIYLTDIPSFTLMYRPQSFHAVNETIWTNFPHQADGTKPPVPPMDCTDGWSIACLYNLKLVGK